MISTKLKLGLSSDLLIVKDHHSTATLVWKKELKVSWPGLSCLWNKAFDSKSNCTRWERSARDRQLMGIHLLFCFFVCFLQGFLGLVAAQAFPFLAAGLVMAGQVHPSQTTNLQFIINIWVTEAGCTKSHHEPTSTLRKTGKNGYVGVP